ncbi:hypothetical protein HD806DRAFT_89456 [Xylariaceae sp. AK1471]|nr:hypothetical protein HD806DRAFT_89456 [Xylariaceae sp. AK1471]
MHFLLVRIFASTLCMFLYHGPRARGMITAAVQHVGAKCFCQPHVEQRLNTTRVSFFSKHNRESIHQLDAVSLLKTRQCLTDYYHLSADTLCISTCPSLRCSRALLRFVKQLCSVTYRCTWG